MGDDGCVERIGGVGVAGVLEWWLRRRTVV